MCLGIEGEGWFDPWLCVCLGIEGEGWFDPWMLVKALKQKNISLGVKYVTGELEEFKTSRGEEYTPRETLVSATVSLLLVVFFVDVQV